MLRYSSHQLQYAAVYIVITFVVLLFLNIYSSGTSQKIFYQNKKTTMIEKCNLAAAEIANLEVLNSTTVTNAVSQMGNLRVTRLIITDLEGVAMYDSMNTESNVNAYVLLPEVVQAMSGKGYDVFSWRYANGAMQSHAAVPVFSHGTMVGCAYMMEYDVDQGALINSLHGNILAITLVLELVVIIFSFAFAVAFNRRIRKIMTSMRIIRSGDYSHKVNMGGQDELTALGEEFNDLTDKLQTSENIRRQFVSDASHELKTPLASIKLLTDSILQNDMDMDTVREFVGDIGNEAERLNRMSQKLLSLNRIETLEDSELEIIHIAPTIERVVHMLSGIAQSGNIHIHLDISCDSQVLILEDDLYQIAFNLIENGIKYNSPGGKLTVRLYQENDNAVMQVIDTGVGIPEDAIDHIFERFYRVDKARSRKSGGSGLGLAIVKSLVERNQGEISVSSIPGIGTTFTVEFPLFETGEEDEE